MLNLVYGISGSGKTEYVINCLKRDALAGKHAYMIVPEQQAFICERTVLPQLPPSAGLCVEVISFSRLAESVFRRFGGITLTGVDHGIRSLVMWTTIRDLSPMLEEYKNISLKDRDFCDMMLKETDELRSCGISAAELERAADQLKGDSPLRRRLRDISLIYASYENLLSESFETNGKSHKNLTVTDTLTRLNTVLEEKATDIFKDCNVYIDSFTGFTHPEFLVLKKIFERCDNVTVTLCTDKSIGSEMHTKGIALTSARLRNLADKVGIAVNETLLEAKEDNLHCTEFGFLKKNLWNFEATDAELKAEAQNITNRGHISIGRCKNQYSEVEIAVIHILSLIQSGMKYSDIAIVARDVDSYSGIIESMFEKYNIPFFLSERTDILTKPLTKHLIYALKVITSGYRLNDVLTLARTGFYDATPEEIDLFEEYCNTWSISGSRFSEKVWSMNPDGYTVTLTSRGKNILAVANKVKALIFVPLMRLAQNLRASSELDGMCDAIRRYMSDINVREKQKKIAEYELASKNYKDAGETLRLYEFIINSLNSISSLFPHLELNTEEFCCVLTLVFGKTDIGSVPAISDYVTIGSASMLRLENIKATILIGLNEGEFPQTVKDSGLLSDAEKETLLELGIVLDSRNELLASDELFFALRAMAKPSERLVLLYRTADINGNSCRPSGVITRVNKLFPYITETDFTNSSVEQTNAKKQTANAASVLPSTVSDFYGGTINLTQSKISSFVHCPYGYYCTYVLKLREKKVAQIGYADAGTFIHYVLENYVKLITENGQTAPKIPSEEKTDGIIRDILSGYISKICPPEFFSDGIPVSLMHRFSKLGALAQVLIVSINEEFSKSKFRPAFFELSIGNGDGDIRPYEIPLANGKKVCINGKIDRVDLFKKDGQIYVRVVDYKSGSKTLSLSEVKSGEDLQLLLYLFTFCKNSRAGKTDKEENGNPLPAGAMYMSTYNVRGKDGSGNTQTKRSGLVLSDEDVLLAMNEDLDPKFISDAKKKDDVWYGKSVCSADDFDMLWNEICHTVEGIATDICSGVATKNKSEKACRFCRVADYCSGKLS